MQKQKILLLLFAFINLSLILASCQSDTSLLERENFLIEIAKSDLYQKYQEVVNEKQYWLATGSFDLQGINSLLKDHLNLNSICEFKTEWFDPLRGGRLYYELSCQYRQVLDQLEVEYGYRSLSFEEKVRVEEIYELETNQVEKNRVRTRVFEQIQNRN